MAEPDTPKALVPVTSEKTIDTEAAWKLMSSGDLRGLLPAQKLSYVIGLCDRLGLDPTTGPFQFLELDGKLVLYATRACTEQLRKLNTVSLKVLSEGWIDEEKTLWQTRVEAWDSQGRRDTACGVVSKKIRGKDGKERDRDSREMANLPMLAETKAKRRATLSICGLGFLDESEIEGTKATVAKPIRTDQRDKLAQMASTKWDQIKENMKGYGAETYDGLTEAQADFIITLLED